MGSLGVKQLGYHPKHFPYDKMLNSLGCRKGFHLPLDFLLSGFRCAGVQETIRLYVPGTPNGLYFFEGQNKGHLGSRYTYIHT